MIGLSFLANGEFFAVNVKLVQKIMLNMAVTPVPTAPETVAGIANMKGRVVTVLSLAALLGCGQGKRCRSLGTLPARGTQVVSSVVFKPFSDGDDEMALLVDKLGDLIFISDNEILPPPLTWGAEEKSYISGIAETEEKLYRIINVESIVNRFINGGEKTSDTMSVEGWGENGKN